MFITFQMPAKWTIKRMHDAIAVKEKIPSKAYIKTQVLHVGEPVQYSKDGANRSLVEVILADATYAACTTVYALSEKFQTGKVVFLTNFMANADGCLGMYISFL